jgi:hypothetical protein
MEAARRLLRFNIHRDGHISGLKLEPPSGLASADKAFLNAIIHAAPFRFLPPGSGNGIELRFTFDYSAPGTGQGYGDFRPL